MTQAPESSFTKFIKGLTQSDRDDEESKGPNDPPWVRQVAMLTGILAALAGFLTVRSTNLTNEAIYQSNQAILAQAIASDSWAEYQADSIKARIVETEILPSSPLNAEDKSKLTKIDDGLRERQPQSKKLAEDKEHERDDHMSSGLKRLGEKDLLGYAGLAAQLGIALASVAALVRRRFAFHAGILVGTFGILITAYAFLVHFFNTPLIK